MIIILNGLKEDVPENISIQALIEFVKEGDPHLIVEQNGRYIYPTDYHSTIVKENDVIEFINPDLGG
ncbi:sulfur carrier protein ThiS [Desulfobacula phenolica]|uniref:Thiamine biosynthesis protein ThiS n=1 Tax=Desulfobacula phenolica TaxID=90732 RepID=A0A1H2JTA3_9BACT|nr:sulfur carrier protein ThiS [Desulfobacula phenolica]SDU59640.1 thiamine biosynthesis protein ThiS [Desulfobacula phenolica]